MIEATRPALMEDKYLELWQVYSVKQASVIWGYHENTIRQAIYSGKLAARKVAREWIISHKSLVDTYGPPIHKYFQGIYDELA